MQNKPEIGEVIDRLWNKWWRKEGVEVISDEEVDGELCIVFLVCCSRIRKNVYPQSAEGYKVIVKKTGKIVRQ